MFTFCQSIEHMLPAIQATENKNNLPNRPLRAHFKCENFLIQNFFFLAPQLLVSSVATVRSFRVTQVSLHLNLKLRTSHFFSVFFCACVESSSSEMLLRQATSVRCNVWKDGAVCWCPLRVLLALTGRYEKSVRSKRIFRWFLPLNPVNRHSGPDYSQLCSFQSLADWATCWPPNLSGNLLSMGAHFWQLITTNQSAYTGIPADPAVCIIWSNTCLWSSHSNFRWKNK